MSFCQLFFPATHAPLCSVAPEHNQALIFHRVVLLFEQWGGGIQCNKGVLHNRRPVIDPRNGLANLGWGGSRGRRCVVSMPNKSWTFQISITNIPEAILFSEDWSEDVTVRPVSHWETLAESKKTLISVEKSYVLQRVTIFHWLLWEKHSASTDPLCFRQSDFSNSTILLFWPFWVHCCKMFHQSQWLCVTLPGRSQTRLHSSLLPKIIFRQG